MQNLAAAPGDPFPLSHLDDAVLDSNGRQVEVMPAAMLD